MPFRPDPFLRRFEPLRKVRQFPAVGYAVAVAAVAIATALRSVFANYMEGGAFLSFFPALIVATFFGGWRTGLLALALSTAAVDYFFLAPIFSLEVAPNSVGALAAFVVVGLGVVALVKLVNVATDRLAAQADKAKFVIEAAPTGLIGVDAQGIIQLVNAAVEDQLGYNRADLIGKPVEDLIPADLRTGHVGERLRYMEDPSPRRMGVGRDLRALKGDGAGLPVEIGLSPFDRDGEHGALASIVDISERKAAESRQQLLIGEIRHRSQNLMTIVRAIAARTLPKPSQEAFIGILEALERTQQLLFDPKGATLRQVVERELETFLDQATIDGCDFTLEPRLAQDFTLIVHELATNAIKHGALSAQAGRVHVAGTQGQAGIEFTWQEANGPLVVVPLHAGFGQRILRDLPKGFGANTRLDYEPAGLAYSLRPAQSLADQASL